MNAPHGRCAMCGGPLFPNGGVEKDGKEVHVVCSVTENGDPDMNPEWWFR